MIKLFKKILVLQNSLQCPKNNMNLRIKTEPVTIGAGVMLYVWFPCQLIVNKNRTYTVASTQAVTGIVFKTEVEINFLSQRRICIAR